MDIMLKVNEIKSKVFIIPSLKTISLFTRCKDITISNKKV